MSIETYERQFALMEIYKKLAEAEAQVAEGMSLLNAEEVFNKMRNKRKNL